MPTYKQKNGLYRRENEHDSCGVGFVANIKGEVNHQVIEESITILKNLEHRGATGGDMKTGDGAGILLQIPHKFFSDELAEKKIVLPPQGEYGLGFIFLPHGKKQDKVIKMIELIVKEESGHVIAWRDVPVNPESLGVISKGSMPHMKQVFVAFSDIKSVQLERKLYILRRLIEKQADKEGLTQEEFYIPSMSSRTVVYKGMFVAPQFESFYPDLNNKKFVSAFALVHQRYSTNTFPSWALAQPFRYVAHNGEINTLKGNVNYMKVRESTLKSEFFGDEIEKILPVIEERGSDSSIFDNTFELLVSSGRSLEHVMMMMIPEAFGVKYHISQDRRAFYEYHASFMEPWDGPAAMAFTDGKKIGAVLDRNGLRPARYVITKSGKFVLASEMGVVDIDPTDVLEKGRLSPGKMILVDTEEGRVKKDNEIKSKITRQQLYRRWLDEHKIELKRLLQPPEPVYHEHDTIVCNQVVFGYSLEDINMIIKPMAENAQEPVGSMGNDEIPAVLSARPKNLFKYFKQKFAQVTNPPIDPYRENLVMSLMSFIGRERNLLDESPEHCKQLKLIHPVLSNEDIAKLLAYDNKDLRTCRVDMLFNPGSGAKGMEKAIEKLCIKVEKMIDKGYSLVIISDADTDSKTAPIPSLLAVSAVNSYLVSRNKRHLVGLIVESGEIREVMDFALLIGFGASAINPYLAFETISELVENGTLSKHIILADAIENYITAVKKGLLKIMSKMGVSTIRSYKGAQLFEPLGLNSEFLSKYMQGIDSSVQGIGLTEIAKEVILKHKEAFSTSKPELKIESGGSYHYRVNGEAHHLTPEAVIALQKAVITGDYNKYKQFSGLINNRDEATTLRSLFAFKNSSPVPIEEVENENEIVKRFVSSAMSFGSISKEAHETLAIAMNRLGAQSNSGEGGESESRFLPLPNGDMAMSKVKQVASGRFGVTSNYLINAEELQIKMAQGAKPGEGGQLPGHKVNEVIAGVRNSTPGVMLISPPPHHDIYSIEDLAQLIYDLKNANPYARVSVKLVSVSGVGTIAAGVAKGKADMVLISGADGGTGASPLSSIKHAGIPWEIGLAESHQTLIKNNLRSRIRIQVDGQIRTGRDVVIAALLGAEEFGFGTVSLITLGCIMMRKCHLNTCPVGVATQDEFLRKRFTGKPENVVNYMMFVARETRELMAELGFRKFDEMVGRSDILKFDKKKTNWKSANLDFSKILYSPESKVRSDNYCSDIQQKELSEIDRILFEKAKHAIENEKEIRLFASLKNSYRSVGTLLSAEISKQHGSKGLPYDSIKCNFTGVAGESFGAFLAKGVSFELEGDANDYLGKGLSGGKIVIFPPAGVTYHPHKNIITGNVALFGATSGEVYINGRAGERFAVRNSGAIAVVEGIGDHGCEYMTGGTVVILGETGVNFAAGMSGGIAYVLDESQLFDTRCNLEMVDLEVLSDPEDKNLLYTLIKRHNDMTRSPLAREILKHWDETLPKFVKVFPIDYKKALKRMSSAHLKTADHIPVTEEVYN